MNQPIDGYIKFNCILRFEQDAVDMMTAETINISRKKLFEKTLIGMYPNGIGYGNISLRKGNSNEFYISGSATGGIEELENDHYVLVNDVNIRENIVHCIGSIHASSETMSHAVIYQANKAINAVVHIHNHKMWETHIDKLPTTAIDCAYGTPEMAEAIFKIVQEHNEPRGIIITAGHEEGVITYAETLSEATEIALKHYVF